jgi:hypothetical protein
MFKSISTIVVLALFTAAALAGQGMNGRLGGNVRAEDGTYLAGVTVTALNIKTNGSFTTTTAKKKGVFHLYSLDPGTYQVSFDREGYESLVVSGVQLSSDQSLTLRIKLKKSVPPPDTAGGA